MCAVGGGGEEGGEKEGGVCTISRTEHGLVVHCKRSPTSEAVFVLQLPGVDQIVRVSQGCR